MASSLVLGLAYHASKKTSHVSRAFHRQKLILRLNVAEWPIRFKRPYRKDKSKEAAEKYQVEASEQNKRKGWRRKIDKKSGRKAEKEQEKKKGKNTIEYQREEE
jgi:hypothetical protein